MKRRFYDSCINQSGNIYLRNLVFSLLLLSLLFGSLGWHTYSYLGDRGLVKKYHSQEFFNLMGHTRAWYEGPHEGKFFSGIFQEMLEKAAADHFPLPILLGYIETARWFNGKFISVLPISMAPVSPAGGDILSLRDENRLIHVPQVYFLKKYEYLKKRAEYFNDLSKNYPELRFFVFPILPVEEWLATSRDFWKGSKDILAGNKWVMMFENLLISKVVYSWGFKGLTPNEVISFYYLTDHHFTMPGAYRIYRQLLGLLERDSQTGYKPLTASKWFVVPKVRFRGGLARLSGKFGTFYDVLEDANFGLPSFKVIINASKGLHGTSVPMKEEYLHGLFPAGEFVWHYGKYYGDNYGLIHYICEEAPGRNLLVLSDSFDNTITPLLSSHYRQSFFVDLRHYREMLGESFNFDEFIEKHEINDVIFFGRQRRILGFSPMDQ